MAKKQRVTTQSSQLVFGLLIALAMLLAGCANSGASGSQLATDQKFIWPVIGAGAVSDLVLDPANVSDYYSSTVINSVFGGLVTVDRNLNVMPDMATWEISPDGRQYTFHIQQNLHFSDGAPLVAQDFAYSIDRSLDPNVCIPYSGPSCVGSPVAGTYLIDIKGAADRVAGNIPSIINNGLFTPDAQTLVIKLERPVAYFLEALTYPTAYPVEKSLIQKYGDDWTKHLDEAGCTGPFIIKSYADGKTLTLVPNPYWYGGKKLTLKEIVRPFVLDPADAYTGYRHGLYDYSDVPSQEYQAARDQADFHEVGLLQTLYISFNQLMKPFDDLSVRQAFALALNKQLIADRVLNGAVLPTNHIVPQGMPGFYDGLTTPGTNTRSVTGDADHAQQLIKQYFATCNCNGALEIKLFHSDTTDRRRIAQALKNTWETVLSGTWGKVTIDTMPVKPHDLFNTYLPNTVGNHKGAMQAWLIGWVADYPDPQDWLSLQFTQNSFNNAANYRDGPNFQVWPLLQQADVEQNPAKRADLYHQAEQLLVDDVAWLPLAQPKGIWRLKTYIQGYNPSALNLISDQDWANFSVLAH